jgi:hypothetical protein
MGSIITTAGAVVAGQVLALLGVWLRLRSRIRQEDVHRRLLVDVLHALPAGGRVHERSADGACLTVASGPAE